MEKLKDKDVTIPAATWTWSGAIWEDRPALPASKDL